MVHIGCHGAGSFSSYIRKKPSDVILRDFARRDFVLWDSVRIPKKTIPAILICRLNDMTWNRKATRNRLISSDAPYIISDGNSKRRCETVVDASVSRIYRRIPDVFEVLSPRYIPEVPYHRSSNERSTVFGFNDRRVSNVPRKKLNAYVWLVLCWNPPWPFAGRSRNSSDRLCRLVRLWLHDNVESWCYMIAVCANRRLTIQRDACLL